MKVQFTERGWADYLYWQEEDKKVLARLNALIKDCQRSPFSGIGKPEPLRNELAGWWSRRIDQEHRLVYQMRGDQLIVGQCRYHYRR